MYNTLSGCKILWVGQVDAVESSSARFPPPAALEHGGAVEAGSVVVPFESDLHFAVISLLRFTTDAHKQKKKKARRKLFFLFPYRLYVEKGLKLEPYQGSFSESPALPV